MSRVMFAITIIATLITIAVIGLAVLSFLGYFANPYMDPGM